MAGTLRGRRALLLEAYRFPCQYVDHFQPIAELTCMVSTQVALSMVIPMFSSYVALQLTVIVVGKVGGGLRPEPEGMSCMQPHDTDDPLPKCHLLC